MEQSQAFMALADSGQFSRALKELRRAVKGAASNPEQSVLLCELLVRVGELAQSRKLAASLLEGNLPPALATRAEIAIAYVEYLLGHPEDSYSHFQRAIGAAEAGGCAKELAWARLRHFRALATYGGEAAVAALPLLRITVRRAGDASATIALHTMVGEVETRAGATVSAHRHLRLAESLVADYPSAHQKIDLNVAWCCLKYFEGDAEAVAHFGAEAVRLADDCGYAVGRLAARTNLGHAYLKQKQLDAARALLQQALELCHAAPIYRPAVLDGLAQVALMERDFSLCEKLLAEGEPPGTEEGVYLSRYARVTRIALLMAQGRWAESAKLAEMCLKMPMFVQDAFASTCIRPQLARSLVALGQHKEAAEVVLDGAVDPADIAESSVGMVLAAMFEGLDDSTPLLKRTIRRRATNARRRTSLLTADTPSDEQQILENDPLILEYAVDSGDAFASAMQTAAEITDLGSSPADLARHTAESLRGLGIEAQFIPQPSGTKAPDSARREGGANSHEIVTANCGRVVADGPADFSSAATLFAFHQLAHTSMAAAMWKATEREKLAVWSIEEPPGTAVGVFASDAMRELLRIAERIASVPVTVLITGETGAGKEILAKAIHEMSPRRRHPITGFNCSAVPSEMMESQLFGFRRGSFTGALDNSAGLIRSAQGGTVLLDEIGEMPLGMQPKLLRFLDSSEVLPIGESRPVPVDVRVIAATNADIDKMVADGRFRQDLFYRLNIIRLHVPPLRDRREEIPQLVEHSINRFCEHYRKPIVRISDEVLEYLLLYSWPGNVRQLANEVRRIVTLTTPGTTAGPESLSPEILQSRRTAAGTATSPTVVPAIGISLEQPLDAATEALERAIIEHALKKAGGRLEETARLLGLSRKGLYLKRVRYGLEPPAGSGSGATTSPDEN